MRESIWLLYPVFFPIAAGIFLLCAPFLKNRKVVITVTSIGLIITALSIFGILCQEADSYTLFYLTKSLPVFFKIDGIGRIFVVVVTVVWLCSGAFAFAYMKHDRAEKRYFGFYLIVYGVLAGLGFSGNIITFYMFYEIVTLTSVFLVLHTKSRESIMAGLKYLFYSFCGAYFVLYGIYVLFRFSNTLTFTMGGVLNQELIQGREPFLLIVTFFMVLGFGVKAGMFPLHGWLPTAHPVAPAPASAVLSGIIVKCGVFGIIRVIYYLFGPDFVRGSWIQTIWMSIALFTVFMGSMLAYREKVFKKRLAYSTVSQISYILIGLAYMNMTAFTGAVLHMICHAFIKSCLFLCVGAIISQSGRTNVDEMRGIGKEMPVVMWCYTICSLALIGIPPTGGFISKWFLAMGALQSDISFFDWFGPAVLLASALLTAGYLLPVTIQGFFPGNTYDYESKKKREPGAAMILPLLVLTVLTVAAGMFPDSVIKYITANMLIR